MNNAMIDKNIQLLERDNEQDTREEQSKVSIAEDPSRLVHAEERPCKQDFNLNLIHIPMQRLQNIVRSG